jgi:uncharacterized protein
MCDIEAAARQAVEFATGRARAGPSVLRHRDAGVTWDHDMPTSLTPSEIHDASLAAKVEFLLQPASYPESTRGVCAIETHMSWVFLTDRHAYKLKKPIKLAFLDFSTLERRKHYCEEEVRLNRRLAPSVYLGTVPIATSTAGEMFLGGPGAAAEWLVKMHRLPADRMLDQAIRLGNASAEDVDRFAQRLAAFYRAAPPVTMVAEDYRRRFEAWVAENLDELRDCEPILPAAMVESVHSIQLGVLRNMPELFDNRVAEHRIIEAHGDLRPEHVCLGPEPDVIDCLEFNREFRLLDPVDELAFFSLECEILGAPDIGNRVLDRYLQDTHDAPPWRLLCFYKSYRACLRAKIAVWHIREPDGRAGAKWPALAQRYLALADGYARQLV